MPSARQQPNADEFSVSQSSAKLPADCPARPAARRPEKGLACIPGQMFSHSGVPPEQAFVVKFRQ